MATVRIEDVIVPEVFDPYMQQETAEKAAVFTSGLVVMNSDLSTKLGGGGEMFQTPVWNDLSDANGSDIGSDNPNQESTPDKLTSYKMFSRRQVRTKSWSSMDLTQELAGSKPMEAIVRRTGTWWARDINRIAIATINGVINANIANNTGDATYAVGVGAGTSNPDAALSDGTEGGAVALLEAKQTMGDMADALSILMVHSRVYTNLQKLQLIDYIPNARGEVNIPTYLGYRLIVSDNLPVTYTGSGSNYYYTSYLSAPGLLAWGENSLEMPTETERKPAKGNGTGQSILYTRRQFALHPIGHSWRETTVVEQFPSNTELELATNWERKLPERKQLPFVAIRSLNG